jgi:4-hydroxy-tetrahydrodipicolinate reductase
VVIDMQRVAILGANGRMGVALIRLIAASDTATLSGALTEPGHATVGRDAGQLAGLDAGGVLLTDQLDTALADCDVAIDFTAPAATLKHVQACAARGCSLVIGTTGLGPAELDALRSAAGSIALLYSRNMSIGITVLTELVRQAARLLGPGFDVEITEAHHRAKKDAPSGTALQLGEAVAQARAQKFADVAVYDRSGLHAGRPAQAIGFASVRAGSIVGDHTVLLASDEEVLELTHRATDRALFARGALRAASWLADKPPGLYSMQDVLGLSAR